MTQGFSFPGPALQGSVYSSNTLWLCSNLSSSKNTWKTHENAELRSHFFSELPLHKYWSLIKTYSCSVHTRGAVVEVKIPTKHVKHHHFIFSPGHCLKLADPFGQHVKLLKAYLPFPCSNTRNVLIFHVLQSILLYIFVQLLVVQLSFVHDSNWRQNNNTQVCKKQSVFTTGILDHLIQLDYITQNFQKCIF